MACVANMKSARYGGLKSPFVNIHPLVFHTSEGKELDPRHAFSLDYARARGAVLPFVVMYKGTPLQDIMNYADNVNYDVMVISGYLAKTDCFVFVNHSRHLGSDDADRTCCICLDQLHEGQTLSFRFYGDHCYHDAHMGCAQNCKNGGTWFGKCCSYATSVHATHTVPVSIVKSRVDKQQKRWITVNEEPVVSRVPEEIFLQVQALFKQEGFIANSEKPYNHTVDSYHETWKKHALKSQDRAARLMR